jgi:Spy/CpxP family protein refolding chaperone
MNWKIKTLAVASLGSLLALPAFLSADQEPAAFHPMPELIQLAQNDDGPGDDMPLERPKRPRPPHFAGGPEGERPPHGKHGMRGKRGKGGPKGLGHLIRMPIVAIAIDLTDEQREAIKADGEARKEANAEVMEQLKQAHKDLRDLMKGESDPDEASAVELAETIGLLETQLQTERGDRGPRGDKMRDKMRERRGNRDRGPQPIESEV